MPKNRSHVSGNRKFFFIPGQVFFYLSLARIVEHVSEYIFLIKEKQAKKQKKLKKKNYTWNV